MYEECVCWFWPELACFRLAGARVTCRACDPTTTDADAALLICVLPPAAWLALICMLLRFGHEACNPQPTPYLCRAPFMCAHRFAVPHHLDAAPVCVVCLYSALCVTWPHQAQHSTTGCHGAAGPRHMQEYARTAQVDTAPFSVAHHACRLARRRNICQRAGPKQSRNIAAKPRGPLRESSKAGKTSSECCISRSLRLQLFTCLIGLLSAPQTWSPQRQRW